MNNILELLVETLAIAATLTQSRSVDIALGATYGELKALLERTYPNVDLSRVEAKPDSLARRASLVEDLSDAGAATDAELLAAVIALSRALGQQQAATEAARKIGVDLERVRAGAVKLVDVAGEDVAARVRDSAITGRLEVRRGRGGEPERTGPQTTVYQLSGNTIGMLTTGEGGALDLEDVERRYLQGLYQECNELALANDGPVDVARLRQPRLQRVYVDLATRELPRARHIEARLIRASVDLKLLEQWLVSALTGKGEKRKIRMERISDSNFALSDDGPSDVDEHIKAEPLLYLEELQSLTANALAQLEKQLSYPEGVLQAAVDRYLSIGEVIAENPQLVLLGDPGGGKSTLTRRLAGVLASQALPMRAAAEQQGLDELVQRFGRWLLPVRIVLSRWAKHLPDNAEGSADDLIAEAVRLLGQTAAVAGLKEHLTARLTDDPPTALLLLDGLDEVTDGAKRAILLKAVQHFCRNYPQVPLIVTCRSRPWAAWQATDAALPLPAFTIAKLEPAAITAFVERWHAELVWAGRYEATAAQQAQARLLQAIADTKRPDLAEMAGTPLLLTMMARVNYSKGLPNSRAALYEEYVRQLLWEWERSKLDERGQPTSLQSLLQQGDVSATSLERALAQLAYQVHAQQAHRDTVDIARSQVREALERIHPGDEAAKAQWAVWVLRLLDDRSGLLYSLDEQTYQFAHRTFQEYLAARWLATGDFLSKFKAKIDQEAWREAIFLALGFQVAVQSEYDNALSVIDELLPEAPITEAEWRRVLLLGEAYVWLLGPQRAGEAEQQRRARAVMRDVPVRLTLAMQNTHLPAQQRLDAGLLLAELDVDPPGLDEFVTVEGWGFKIGRYPITNKQFRRFVDAGGYADERWWPDEEGRRYKERGSWQEPRYWDNARFNCASQPVVGVSWYEACAYCAWLTEELRRSGQIGQQEMVRLPTQAEWEQAARSHDGRDYPWGATFDARKANTKESDLGQTTPVHMYLDGATPEGVWDLSGNVWEWTSDVDTDGMPWLKGGAWFWEKERAISSVRYGGVPDYGDDDFGFRCVVVPSSR